MKIKLKPVETGIEEVELRDHLQDILDKGYATDTHREGYLVFRQGISDLLRRLID